MANYLDYDGLEYYHDKVKASINSKVDKDGDKQLSTEDFTTEEKNKLSNITDGATAVSFQQIQTNGTQIGKITINGNDTYLYAPAGGGDSGGGGVPSISDYVHPTYTAHNLGFYKVKVTNEGHVSEVSQVQKSDITALGVASNDVASTSSSGLMSSSDKQKINGVSNGANKTEFTQTLTSGTEIGTIKIDGTSTKIYAPSGSNSGDSGGGGGDSYTHPTYTAHNLGFYKVKVDNEGHVSEVAQVQKSDITDYGIATTDLVSVDDSRNGLMHWKDMRKLAKYADDPSYYATNEVVSVANSKNGLMDWKDMRKLAKYADDPSYYATNEVVSVANSKNGLMDWRDMRKLAKYADDPSYYATNEVVSVTNNKNGLMHWKDMRKLEGIAENATKVEFTQKQTSGTEIGKITINGNDTYLYAPSGGSGGDCNFTDADKAKLDGIEDNANNYTLPTASSTLGGVKTTSTVTSTSGLTATPIINGVPYYKNTTYSTASSSANGLLSKDDKSKLDGVQTGATAVSFTQTQTSGTEIGTIKINGTTTKLYVPAGGDCDYTAAEKTKVSDLYDYTLTRGTILNAGDDLNDCLGINRWYSPSTSVTSQIVNTPYTGTGFALINVPIVDVGTYYRQFLMPNTGNNIAAHTLYTRHHNTSGWSDWVRLTGATATTALDGLLSKDDKAKLDSVENNANNYTHPTYTAKSSGMYKITVNSGGHVSAATAVAKADITALGIASNDTATTSSAGLMSATDKTRADNLYKYCLSVGTSLAAGTDLNDLTTIGKWYSSSAAISEEIVNTPYTGGGFSLITMYTQSSTTNINQILLPNTTSTAYVMFKRKLATSGWGPWARVTGATATTALDGLLSAADKAKINKIPEDIQDQVTDAVNVGAKNLLMNNFTTKTYVGITATSNPDGSITLNGTSTASGAFIMCWNLQTGTTATQNAQQFENNQKWLPTGKYILSGGIAGKANIQVRMATEDNSEGTGIAASNTDVTFTVTDAHKYVWNRIYIAAGASFNNETIYPMVRPATVKDNTYVPYAKTNQQLSYKKYYTATRETSSFNPAITTNLAALTPGIDIFVEMSYCASLSYDGNTDASLYTTLLDGSVVAKGIYLDNNVQLKLGLLHPGVWHLVYDGTKWIVADELPCVKYPYATVGNALTAGNIVGHNATGQLVTVDPSPKPFDPTQPIYFCTKAATAGSTIQYAMVTKFKGVQSIYYGNTASGQAARNGPVYAKVKPSTTKGLWTVDTSTTPISLYYDLSKVAAGGYYMKLLNRYDSLAYSFELTEDHPVFLVQSDIITRVL